MNNAKHKSLLTEAVLKVMSCILRFTDPCPTLDSKGWTFFQSRQQPGQPCALGLPPCPGLC